MCEVCHDTGFELIKNDAHYCKCDRGQRMQEAHRRRSRNGSHAARGGLGQMIRQSGKSMIRDAFRRAYEARKEREGGSR
jgi:hypothetical protein